LHKAARAQRCDPGQARGLRVTGHVVVVAVLEADGRLDQMRVTKADPYELYRREVKVVVPYL